MERAPRIGRGVSGEEKARSSRLGAKHRAGTIPAARGRRKQRFFVGATCMSLLRKASARRTRKRDSPLELSRSIAFTAAPVKR